MKKIIFLFILSIILISCSEDKVNNEYPIKTYYNSHCELWRLSGWENLDTIPGIPNKDYSYNFEVIESGKIINDDSYLCYNFGEFAFYIYKNEKFQEIILCDFKFNEKKIKFSNIKRIVDEVSTPIDIHPFFGNNPEYSINLSWYPNEPDTIIINNIKFTEYLSR